MFYYSKDDIMKTIKTVVSLVVAGSVVLAANAFALTSKEKVVLVNKHQTTHHLKTHKKIDMVNKHQHKLNPTREESKKKFLGII